MIRERIGEAALRAYPPALRRTRGPEMLGMLLDAGEQSRWALVRESGSLVLGGLRERAAITARAGTRRLIADSCCQAVLIFLTLWIVTTLNREVIAGPSRQLLVEGVVPLAILVCALVGYERVAAIGGLAAIAAFSPLGPHARLVPLVALLVPIACLLVMVSAPRRRSHDPRRLLWLAPVCVLAALHAEVGLPALLVLISLGGLLALFHDPRLAIACGLVWIFVLAHALRPVAEGLGVLGTLSIVAAGLMLPIAAGRLWSLRRGAAA